jgi:phosphotransacetylase
VLNMAGVVSGDAGAGLFAGEVLALSTSSNGHTTYVTALYHINGGKHQFTARLSVTQDNTKGTAVLKGRVTDGWMQGAEVSGSYQVINPSNIINAQNGVGGDICYQGTLHIQR